MTCRVIKGPRSWCRLFLGDCEEVLPTLKGRVDLLISDPPYGIDYAPGRQKGAQNLGRIQGDASMFDPSHLFGICDDILLWGANNYRRHLPDEGQFYFWDKVLRNGLKVQISEAEYAWHLKGTKPRGFRHLWSGAYRASESSQRNVHPTQKPIVVMSWCLSVMKAEKGQVVVDPYAGSGTTGISCLRDGLDFVGIEKDPVFYEVACRRLERAATHAGFGI